MEYDKLLFSLNKVINLANDTEVKRTLYELRWTAEKGGISGLTNDKNIDTSVMIDFLDLMQTLATTINKSKNSRISKMLKSIFNDLEKNGIDGIIPSSIQKEKISRLKKSYTQKNDKEWLL